ncbi:MAG TPA: DNA-processing protein DprA [Natronosporangium sp.]|nr:DNA-processing protein DprA [Natronosporangium sp.]
MVSAGHTAREEARLARVALGWLAEPGDLRLWMRVHEHGPVRVLQELADGERERIVRRAADGPLGDGIAGDCGGVRGGPPGDRGAGPDDPPSLADLRRLAERTLAAAGRLGARAVIPEDEEWPHRLDQLVTICDPTGRDPIERDAAPPLCLWVRGPWRLDEALDSSVAVVGARAATSYGIHVAREIGYGLAEREWTVVSGGAFGVDAYAHRGALAAGGVTVAVLACGIDRAYPASHAGLFDQIAEEGLLVSEWPPGAEPFRHRFLIRNRVIAAMACGTVVVEASARSGSLATLRRAGQLGRHRMAVPGPVTSAMSVGCHEQLRDPEVHLVTGVPHILDLVGRIGTDLAVPARGPRHPRDELGPVEQRLLEALLVRKPLPTETVAARAGVGIRDAMRLLPDLADRGLARRRGDGYVLVRDTGRSEADPGPAPGAP